MNTKDKEIIRSEACSDQFWSELASRYREIYWCAQKFVQKKPLNKDEFDYVAALVSVAMHHLSIMAARREEQNRENQ